MEKIIIGLLFVVPLHTTEQTVTPEPPTIPEMIEKYSEKYHVDKTIISKVIKCESSFNPKAVNWQDSHKLSKGSHGIAQFSYETFNTYSKEIGIKDGDPYNPDQAIETMAYMFSKGKANHWSCFKKI